MATTMTTMTIPTPSDGTTTVVHGLAGLRTLAGKDLGTTGWFEITQGRVDTFADATDDHQWIHVDADRAAAGPFGAPIAHGYLTVSLLVPLFAELLDARGIGSDPSACAHRTDGHVARSSSQASLTLRPGGEIVIVCQCRAVSDRTVEAALADGARTLSAVCRSTGAAQDCGSCIFTVKAQVCHHLARESSLLEVDGAAS